MSLLERTDQRWKVYLFAALMAVGAGVTLFQWVLAGPLGEELARQLALGGMVLVIATFIWAGGSIVCPACRCKLLFYAITKVGLGTWFNWLLEEERCPKCAFDGRKTTNGGRRGRRKG